MFVVHRVFAEWFIFYVLARTDYWCLSYSGYGCCFELSCASYTFSAFSFFHNDMVIRFCCLLFCCKKKWLDLRFQYVDTLEYSASDSALGQSLLQHLD